MSRGDGRRMRPINIQAGYLFENLKEGREVAVALTTGKFKGVIKRFDRFAVIFRIRGQEILVYKQAILWIARAKECSNAE